METEIISYKKLNLKDAVLIVGLPGVGLVARTTVKYMIDKTKAKLVAEIFSPYFPSQVVMKKDASLEPFRCELYYKKINKKDILFLTGETQPTSHYGQYEFTNKILIYMKKIGVKEVIALGGYGIGKYKTKKEIHGFTSNDIKDLKKMKIAIGKMDGIIAGLAGLIPTFAKQYGIKGICLLGETHGNYIDIECAYELADVVTKYLKINVDLKEIKKQAEEGAKLIKKLENELKNKMKHVPEEGHFSYIR